MAKNLNNLMKQAQQMQQKVTMLQKELESRELDVSSGGIGSSLYTAVMPTVGGDYQSVAPIISSINITIYSLYHLIIGHFIMV